VIAVARYLLAGYVRSRACVVPAAALVCGVVLLYSVAPNPVLPSAGGVAAFLFFAQAWLAHSFFNAASPADRHTIAAAAGRGRLARGRLLGSAVLAAVAAGVALGYPLLAGRFDAAPGLPALAVGLLASLAATVGATGLAALFAEPLVRNRTAATLGLTVAALLTIPLGLPAVAAAKALDTHDATTAVHDLTPDLASTAVFAAVVVLVVTRLWRE
jgi:hypothetical protein